MSISISETQDLEKKTLGQYDNVKEIDFFFQEVLLR